MPKYTYNIRYGNHGLQAEVAIFDPEARGYPDGGPRFGYEAEVLVSEAWLADEGADPSAQLRVEVSQGSIGSVNPESARLRADVHMQAIEMAEFCEDALRWGASTFQLGAYLKDRLEGEPTAHRFSYGKQMRGRIVSTRGQRAEHPVWTSL